MARSTRRKRGISLPWERRGAQLRGLLAGPRWKVLLLVLVLAGLGTAIYGSAERRAKERETRMAIAEVHRAVASFRDDIGRCPERTAELVRPPRAGVRYLREIPRDAWGRRLFVRCPSRYDPETVDVVSAGPSGDFFVDDNVQ